MEQFGTEQCVAGQSLEQNSCQKSVLEPICMWSSLWDKTQSREAASLRFSAFINIYRQLSEFVTLFVYFQYGQKVKSVWLSDVSEVTQTGRWVRHKTTLTNTFQSCTNKLFLSVCVLCSILLKICRNANSIYVIFIMKMIHMWPFSVWTENRSSQWHFQHNRLSFSPETH